MLNIISLVLDIIKKIGPKSYGVLAVLIVVAVGGVSVWLKIETLTAQINAIKADNQKLITQLEKERTERAILSDKLNAEIIAAKEQQKALDVYADIIGDTMKDLHVIETKHAELRTKTNQLEISKNFGQWAASDEKNLSHCMESIFNQLPSNYADSTANRNPSFKNPLHCTASTTDNHTAKNHT